jgi:hypothetical protein
MTLTSPGRVFPELIALLALLMTVAPRYRRLTNLPGIDAANLTPAQASHLTGLHSWLKAGITVLFAYIAIQTMRIAMDRAAGLGAAMFPVSLVVILGTVGWFYVRIRKAR